MNYNNRLKLINTEEEYDEFKKIYGTLNDRLKISIQKHKKKLIGYYYTDDYSNLNENYHIIYINKNNYLIKNGFFKKINDDNSIILSNGFQDSCRKWVIQSDDYFIFFKEKKTRNKVRDVLESFIRSSKYK